ncbi:CYFA0S09e03774g1_1 [Cyberlindnera fabianii]|uniref:GTP-binding protein RHO4 n=1 Tax=Cyberlindnera fabianii TaxID=36022 RepID=A0A061AY18_CYBFA|nr:GTP-binding protein RHO4 [Cyberlindnera fabianii]CDR42446.1 CYFA0S09e03774g1_1 [Cyberlindnera fabianii]
MSTLSKPYYNSQRIAVDDPSSSSTDGTFKVIKTSFETPYDTARKRQSQLPDPTTSNDTNTPSTNNPNALNVNEVDSYQLIDADNKRRPEYRIKLVVVGDGGCGKTCLLIVYSQGDFPTAYVPTIFENYITNVTSSTGKKIELALWDTAGQEEYDRLRPLSYPDVNVLLVCYAVNNSISLQNIRDKWAPEVKHFCPGVPIIVVGTKTDLLNSGENSEVVSFQEADYLAREIGAVHHIRCSAKTTENVNQIFNTAITTAMKEFYDDEPQQSTLNIFKKKPVKKTAAKLDRSEAVSDYYRNSEYDMSDVPTNPTKKRKLRRVRCTIL